MTRIMTTLACVVLLSACSNLPDWAVAHGFRSQDTDAHPGQYNFNWQLSGERQVAPLQIFDDGNKTWLQFMPTQVVPAIFERTPNGDRLLSYVRQGDYLLIDGVWAELSFRGGLLHASAQKLSDNGPTRTADVDPIPVSVQAASKIEIQATAEHPHESPDSGDLSFMDDHSSITEPPELDGRGVVRGESAGSTDTISVDKAVIETAAFDADIPGITRVNSESDQVPMLGASYSVTEPAPKLEGSYGITVHDQNFRKALHRWAQQASWTFAPEHWAVDVDIPISGEAIFYGSFQDAVQDLLSATELAERPLRPCFYSNRVLRVVSYSQLCDRSGARES